MYVTVGRSWRDKVIAGVVMSDEVASKGFVAGRGAFDSV